MEPHEKEEMLYNLIHNTVDHFLMETELTYFQVIGVLETIKEEYFNEFKFVNYPVEESEDEGE